MLLGRPLSHLRIIAEESPWSIDICCRSKSEFGLTLYLEPDYGLWHQEIELEGKLIQEKHWNEDALVGAFDYTLKPEWEKANGDTGFKVHLKMEATNDDEYSLVAAWIFRNSRLKR
jgi:hypothetical protein